MPISVRRLTLPLIACCLLTSSAWGAERHSEDLAFAAGVDPAEPDPAPVAMPPTTCTGGVCQVARPRLEALLLAASVELPGCQRRLGVCLAAPPAPGPAPPGPVSADAAPWGWVAVGGVSGALLGAAVAILAVRAAGDR